MKKIICICMVATLCIEVSGCSGSQTTTSSMSALTDISTNDRLSEEFGELAAEWTVKQIQGEYDYVINAFENLGDKFAKDSTAYSELSKIYEECKKAKQENNWKLKHYVDEFGDETDDKYINYVGIGTFSNTATTDSLLKVSILVDTNSGIAIKLYEYGDNVVQNSYSSRRKYTVSVKTPSGDKKTFEGYMRSSSGDRIFMSDNSLLFQFKNVSPTNIDNKMKFHIVDNDRPTTYYDFEVDLLGFSEAYSNL